MSSNLKTRLDVKVQNLKIAPAETAVQSTELAEVESGYVALTTNAINVIKENLKNQPLSYQLFDIVKSPSGGITVFSVPSLNGEEIHKELTGVILDYSTPRAFWETRDPVEGTPPSCYSRDSFTSTEGKPCFSCPYNTFGSKDGDSNAKACKESVQLLLLRPESIMPIIVRIPVSSKNSFLKYMGRLIGNMVPLCGIVTRISLEKATSKGGKPYAQFNFEAVTLLRPDETVSARTYGQQFAELVNAANNMETTAKAV